MKNKKDRVKSGLQRKITILCVVMVIVAIAVFAAVGIMEISIAQRLTENTSRAKSTIINEKSKDSMLGVTRDSLMRTVTLAASLTDEEFWVLEHDFFVLSSQVEDVFLHPENYGEVDINPPKKENEGTYALQVMFAEERYKTDKDTLYMVKRLANLGTMMEEIIAGNGEFAMDCYIALTNGTVLIMDEYSGQKFDKDGKLKPYDPRNREWFQEASKLEKYYGYMSSAVKSYFYDANEIAFSVPVYAEDKLVAVLEGAVNLDNIRDKAEGFGYGYNGFSIILEDDSIIYSPRTEGELMMDSDLSTTIAGKVNKELESFLLEEKTEQVGFGRVTVDDEAYYAAYAPIETIGWRQVMFVPEEEVETPTNDLLYELNKISEESLEEFARVFGGTIAKTFIAFLILIASAVFTALVFSSRIARPLKTMTSEVQKINGDNLVFKKNDICKTGDEIEILADAFEDMSERTRRYIDELMQITSEKERMKAELSVAAHIQKDMLPKDFPIFPERGEFDVYASMNPAKEVGGDFYDIFMIDDDHLALVMGDVSGKGIPAALFMMISKILIQNLAMIGGTPGEILTKVNNKLCEGNSARMFVTVWMGILTISTGHLIEANAGHMHPAFRKNGDNFELIIKKHGPVLGLRKDKTYIDDEFDMAGGDCLFIYTDGVSEAENADQKLYGTDRMIDALNKNADESPEIILKTMLDDIQSYAGDATQSDDITMLAIKYNGR